MRRPSTSRSLWVLFALLKHACDCVVYPPTVCVFGDVQVDYNKQRDPRTLMGTYTFVESIVDISAPMYEHINNLF